LNLIAYQGDLFGEFVQVEDEEVVVVLDRHEKASLVRAHLCPIHAPNAQEAPSEASRSGDPWLLQTRMVIGESRRA
jgi:hypothetical protein